MAPQLFRPQGDHRINIHRTTRRQIAGEQSNQGKKKRDRRVGLGVGRIGVEKQCRQRAAGQNRTGHSSTSPAPISRKPRPIINESTSERCAPRARRTPISRVRCVTR